MNLHSFQLRPLSWSRLQGMFNLNDPRWGRGDEGSSPNAERPPRADEPRPTEPPQRPGPSSSGDGPPDLDEFWRDFNRKLSGLFGGGGAGGGQAAGGPRAVGLQARPQGHRHRRGRDRWAAGAGLAGFRLLHRAGRSAGRHHPVWQVPGHGGGRLQLADAVSGPAPRDRLCDADPLGRCRRRCRHAAPPACASRPC